MVNINSAKHDKNGNKNDRKQHFSGKTECADTQNVHKRSRKLDYPVARRDLCPAKTALSTKEYVAENRDKVDIFQLLTARPAVAPRGDDGLLERRSQNYDIEKAADYRAENECHNDKGDGVRGWKFKNTYHIKPFL